MADRIAGNALFAPAHTVHQAPDLQRRAHIWKSLALLLLLLITATLFRIPHLINAAGVHSDAAVVGLQAQHMLRGEWSSILWGAPYQGSLDALMIAAGFWLAGPTPLTLMAVPMVGYFVLIGCVFATLNRRIGAGCAAVATLAVVLTPSAVNGVTLYAPRQWCITFIALAVWLLDGASESRVGLLHYLIGTLLGVLALYLDLFGLQFMPGLALFAAGCCLDAVADRRKVGLRLGACVLGAAAGLLMVSLLRQQVAAATVPTGSSLERLPGNLQLLLDWSLPWVLGAKVLNWGAFGLEQWQPPSAVQVVQLIGGASLLAGIGIGGLAGFDRRLSWPVRRLGVLGFVVTASSIAGFLVSTSPIDATSVRYLAPIIWTAPYALAPLAERARLTRFAALVTPYLLVAAIGGWLSNGYYVQGALPVRHPRGVAADEARLGEVLRAQGIRYAVANFWQAYRLTFLWNEQPIVVPDNPAFDRYRPYRDAFEQAEKTAMIFHPTIGGPMPDDVPAQLEQIGLRYQRLEVAGFTVLLVDKNACRTWPCSTPPIVAPADIGVDLAGDWYVYELPAGPRWMGTSGTLRLYTKQARRVRLTLEPGPMNVGGNLGSSGQLQIQLGNQSTVVPVESGRQAGVSLNLQPGFNDVVLQLKGGTFIPAQAIPGSGDDRTLSIAFTRIGIEEQPQ